MWSTLVNQYGKSRSELFQVSDDGTNVGPNTRYLHSELARGISTKFVNEHTFDESRGAKAARNDASVTLIPQAILENGSITCPAT